MRKSYLSQQIRLMSITTNDLMSNEEWAIYRQIIDMINKANASKDKAEIASLKEQRAMLSKKLGDLISKHDGIPRVVRLDNVLNPKKFVDKPLPGGVQWWDLRSNKQISEFLSEGARTLGLENLSITFDKIIVKWTEKSADILQQIVFDGFYMDVMKPDGSVERKHYNVTTASAGQMRVSKVQALSDEAIKKLEPLECGMTNERINARGGINVNKILAYTCLSFSATEVWEGFNIDEAIVVQDFEAPVTGRMLFITNEYKHIKGVNTVVIKHTDGAGIFLPGAFNLSNVMVRAPFLKGLISPWDFIKFCKVNNVPAVIVDAWGKEHDLIAENIKVIFTASQLKLWSYYDSWDEYKTYFKQLGCHMCLMNYEEENIKDVPMNYQFIQQLYDMTDDEIDRLVKPTKDYINSIAKDVKAMLRVLGADEDSSNYYHQAIALYNELIREAYSKESLRSIKRRLILDGKSGKLMVKNKRLYVIPDWYAVCENWFMGIKEPDGLLKPDEVGCKVFKNYEKIDVLRSPSLYFEHNIMKVSKDPRVYEWFTTNAIVTSVKSLISKVCQFDCDGDQLNCTPNDVIIGAAERIMKERDIVPLCYNSFKADPELITRESIANGFIRAQKYSHIGEISNMLTRLWNRDEIDLDSAADICFYNNQVIDAAKTAKVIEFDNFPDVKARIIKAAGSSKSKMPYFFQFTPNGRSQADGKKNVLKANNSTMNRICARFDKMPNISMKLAGVPPFNWQMLMSRDIPEYNIAAITTFCEIDDNATSQIMSAHAKSMEDKVEILDYDNVADTIRHELEEKKIPLEEAYLSITKYLFFDCVDYVAHKQMYWRVFGELAVKTLKDNLENCYECPVCKMKVPKWVAEHECKDTVKGFVKCIDCGRLIERSGARQCRCKECTKINRRNYINKYHVNKNKEKKQSA